MTKCGYPRQLLQNTPGPTCDLAALVMVNAEGPHRVKEEPRCELHALATLRDLMDVALLNPAPVVVSLRRA